MTAPAGRTKSGIKKISTICNLCQADDYELVTQGKEHEYENTTDDTFKVVRCRRCQLVYLNPRPDVETLSTIYPPNYYSYNQKALRDSADPNSILQRLRYKGFQAKVEKSLSLACGAATIPGRVLDIGCGDGHTLDLYKQQADVETHGVDFNASALALAANHGHTVYEGRFEDVSLPLSYFDLVTATHVIEHVPDPRQFAEKAFAVLKPGGIFWLETPNIEALDARIFRRNWGGYHFPRHWFFFSRKTIDRLTDEIGFQSELVDFAPNAIFWFWTMHSIILEHYPQARRLADTLFPPIDFQRDTLANFLRICFFCSLDVAIKATTGETANMIVAVRKPNAVPENQTSAKAVL